MPNARQEHSKREALMRTLAGRLEFAVQKVGDCFTLLRTTDVVPRYAQSASRSTSRGVSTNLEIARPWIETAILRRQSTFSVEGKHD